MPNTSAPSTPQSLYILKILLGLLALGLLIATALWLPASGLPPTQSNTVVAVLLVLALSLVPIAHRVYRRRDELQRLQHQQASIHVVALVAAGAAVVGILQANQYLPLFNQFWSLGLLLAAWGVQLMLADGRFR